jgi:CobQ-like glutamine amidotransferase family enzyme
MKIEILFPEVANLFGDLENARYLARCCGAEIVNTSLKDVPAFVSEDIALVYLGSTTEQGQSLVKDALDPFADVLRRRTEAGGVTLVTGNALEIFGDRIENEDGTSEKMLGMFPTAAKRKMMARYNSLYWGRLDDMDIVGFKSQFAHSWGDGGTPLFDTVRGAGLNPEVKNEGFRVNNFMATYVIGPLIILNPPFAKYVLRLMGVEDPVLAFEEAAMDVYRTRLAEFSDPNTGFLY